MISALVALALVLGLSLYYSDFQGLITPVGHNIRIDNYTGIAGDLHGVEPYVAVGKDGTIHVAWIGLQFNKSTTYYDEGPSFQTRIWYSKSTDGGLTFSNPLTASPWGDWYDPSIAITPQGEVLIAYSGVSRDLMVAKKINQDNSFQQIIAVKNLNYEHSFDRPWIAASRNGTVYLVWEDYGTTFGLIFWATSTNGGVTFSTPMQIAGGYWFPMGLTVDENDTVHVAMIGWSLGATNPDQVWYARKPAGSEVFQVKKLTTIQTLFPMAFDARAISLPGPAIAAEGNRVLVAYVSDSDKSLYLTQSNDDGLTWNAALILRSSSALIQMPWLATLKGTTVVAWRENVDGFWNTYYAKYANGTSITPIKVSDQNGYAADVLNWQGDFLGIAFTATDKVVVAWSDGRNLPNKYGYGHVYVSIVRL